MEASVDLSSPKKAKRPAYKAMWEAQREETKEARDVAAARRACVDGLVADLKTAKANSTLFAKLLVGVGTVALIEAVALLILILAAR